MTETDLSLVDHEFVDLDGRLLAVVELCRLDGVVERAEFFVAFSVRF